MQEHTDSAVARGGVIRFTTAGKGPAVILLSGGPGYSSTFLEPVYAHLALHYRAVLVDQRGTGRSSSFVDSTGFTLANSVDDIERVRQRLGVQHVMLLGHSWGGVLAMAYASTYPEHVAGVVLVGSGTLRPALTNTAISQRLTARLTQADLDSIRALSAAVPDPVRRAGALRRIRLLNWKAYEYDPASVNALAQRLTPQSFNEQTARWMYADLVREGPRFAAQLASAARLRSIPVLIVFGAVDPVGTTTVAELQSEFPQATTQVIPRSGHHPWIEAPAAFHAAVDTFLQNTEK
jgi:proline iminopeptidase